MSNRPDWCPEEVWAELSNVAAGALDALPSEGPQMRSHRIQNIVRAILAERERCARVAETRSPDDDNLDWQVRQQVARAIRAPSA